MEELCEVEESCKSTTVEEIAKKDAINLTMSPGMGLFLLAILN